MNLEVRKLSKSFGKVQAVREASFEVAAGEWVALLGASGCGKTTSLRCVAGLERATGGEILLNGRTLDGKGQWVSPQARDLNMVFQSYAIWPHMTVFDNVAYGLRVKRVARREIKQRTMRTLESVQMAPYAERHASELSGGQQQRVALARVLVTEPRLMLFDEPLSNLDAKLRVQMRLELLAIRDRLRKSALYVTHDQAEAMVIADRIIIMDDGRVVQAGTPRDLYEKPKSRFVAEFIGRANVLGGKVTEIVDSVAHVVLTGSELTLTCPIENLPERARSEGSAVSAVVRPHHILPAPDASGGAWEMHVESVAYLGEYQECKLTANEVVIEAQFDCAVHLKRGDGIRVRLDESGVVFLQDS